MLGLSISIHLSSQTVRDQYEKFDDIYGYDSKIYKGAKYIAEHRPQFGHPFLVKSQAFSGSVMAKTYKLDSVELWYDVYKQYLVLGYLNNIGSKQQIVLNSDEVEKFNLGALVFVKNTYEGIGVPYLQQIAADSISCFITYQKEYKYMSNNSKKGFGYSNETRKLYMVIGPKVVNFGNKRTLLNNLPVEVRSKVKSLIKENAIKINKSSDIQLALLFAFINSQFN